MEKKYSRREFFTLKWAPNLFEENPDNSANPGEEGEISTRLLLGLIGSFIGLGWWLRFANPFPETNPETNPEHLRGFIQKYIGSYIDFDGYYGAQCVDLVRRYIDEVWKTPQFIGVNGAKDILSILNEGIYNKILPTPGAIPREGDIIVWNFGEFGHTAIFIEGNANRFTSFDQNYPSGSACEIREHTYDSCIGWFRPR